MDAQILQPYYQAFLSFSRSETRFCLSHQGPILRYTETEVLCLLGRGRGMDLPWMSEVPGFTAALSWGGKMPSKMPSDIVNTPVFF